MTMTLAEAQEFGQRILGKHACPGTDAVRETDELLCWATGLDRAGLMARPDDEIDARAESKYARALTQRRDHWPVERIMGFARFHGREIVLTRDVLVPRPATELVVERALESARRYGCRTAVDVGTGSGCIAVTLAAELPDVHVVATDISPDALENARQSAERNGVADRIEFVFGDMVKGLELGDDIMVVANLPYVPTNMIPELPPEILYFEPRLALDGGADGLKNYYELLHQLSGSVLRASRLVVELLPEQEEILAAVLRQRWPKATVEAIRTGPDGETVGLDIGLK
ncbi:N5-glutamine methyltransferase family protein [Patescibacteria group bacterium]